MRKLLSFFTFFAITPLVLLISIVFFSYRSFQSQNAFNITNLYPSKTIAFSAIPTDPNLIDTQINTSDSRIERLYHFFSVYNSPLANYAQQFVSVADQYGLDYRLLPAIAAQESGLCATAPKDSYNCWGWGIYTHKMTIFSSYADAINSIGRQMSQNYYSKGLTTPESIGKVYNPASPEGWANHINYFINQI